MVLKKIHISSKYISRPNTYLVLVYLVLSLPILSMAQEQKKVKSALSQGQKKVNPAGVRFSEVPPTISIYPREEMGEEKEPAEALMPQASTLETPSGMQICTTQPSPLTQMTPQQPQVTLQNMEMEYWPKWPLRLRSPIWGTVRNLYELIKEPYFEGDPHAVILFFQSAANWITMKYLGNTQTRLLTELLDFYEKVEPEIILAVNRFAKSKGGSNYVANTQPLKWAIKKALGLVQ